MLKPPFSPRLLREIVPRLDLPGFALFAPAAIRFLLALHLGSEGGHGSEGWASSQVIGLFRGAGVTAILFVLGE